MAKNRMDQERVAAPSGADQQRAREEEQELQRIFEEFGQQGGQTREPAHVRWRRRSPHRNSSS